MAAALMGWMGSRKNELYTLFFISSSESLDWAKWVPMSEKWLSKPNFVSFVGLGSVIIKNDDSIHSIEWYYHSVLRVFGGD
jgi:hypothetical protein